jgi:Ca2+/Na+ antiporter
VGNGSGKKANRHSRLKGSAILAGVVFFLVMILNFFTSRDAIDFFESAVMLGLACFGLFLMFYFTKPDVAKIIGALENRALPLLGFKNADWLDLSKKEAFKNDMGNVIQGAYDVSGLERGGHEVVDVVMPKKPRSRVKPEDPNTLNDEADDDVDDGDDQQSDDTVRRA